MISWVYSIIFFVILYFALEKNEGIVKYFASKSMKKVWIVMYVISAIIALGSNFFQNEIKEVLDSIARGIFFSFIPLYFYVNDYREKHK